MNNTESVEPVISKKKNYWTEDTEKYIREYIVTDDSVIKNKIFEAHLYKPLCKMIENITHRYKLYNFPNTGIDDIKELVLCHILINIHKFDVTRDCKAYSYFGTTTKNFLMALVKKHKEFTFIGIGTDLNELYNGDEDNNSNKDNNVLNNIKFSYSMEVDNYPRIINKFVLELTEEIELLKASTKDKNANNWKKFLESFVMIIEFSKTLDFIDNKISFYNSLKKVNGFSNGRNYKYMQIIKDRFEIFKYNYLNN